MEEQKVGQLLNELAKSTAEPVRPGLAEDIKNSIPQNLHRHRNPLGTINIIIDLRVNKLTAAAVIIIVMLVCANFFNSSDSGADNIYRESALMIKYWLGGKTGKANEFAIMPKFYEDLRRQGKDVVYYSNYDTGDSNAVLIHWKLEAGQYKVILADFTTKTVNAEELIKLQSRMLSRDAK